MTYILQVATRLALCAGFFTTPFALAQSLVYGSSGMLGFARGLDAGFDVNGDGVPDLIHGASRGTFDRGEAHVLSGVDGSPIHSVVGPTADSRFGTAVALLGDLDSDGRSEFAVGALDHAGSVGLNQGYLAVYSGATAATLHVREGDIVLRRLGSVVEALGDVTGDGIPDFGVGIRDGGSPGLPSIEIISGSDYSVVRTHSGATFVAGGGDIDGDGRLDYVTTSGGVAGPVVAYQGATGTMLTSVSSTSGSLACAVVGDVNDDGHDDFVFADSSIFGGGFLRVVSGASGAFLVSVTLPTSVNLNIDLARAGDVNGDCVPDLLFAADMSGMLQYRLIDCGGGALLANWILPNTGNLLASIASLGDLDGDRYPEVAVAFAQPAFANFQGGLQVVDWDLPGIPAAMRSTGSACVGSASNLALVLGTGCSRLGATMGLIARNLLPSTPLAFNFAMPISMPLDTAGLPGCTAVASGDGFSLFGAASATGEFSTPNFTVPNDVSLLGAELAAQAIAVDAAANAAGLVASRGLLVRIGN